MKLGYTCGYNRHSLYLLPALLLLFSCDRYYFTHPQPYDKEAVYELPPGFYGRWIDDDSVLVLVDKTTISVVINETEKVVKGAWPRREASGNFTYLPPGYRSFKMVMLDSLQQPVDTVDNFLLNGEHLYELSDKELPVQGYHYSTDDDTLIVSQKDTFCVDIGRNAFVKNIDHGFWAFNIRNQVLGNDSRWWQLFLLEQIREDEIHIWYCSHPLVKSPFMFYEKQNNYFFNSNWTAKELLDLTKSGGFEPCNRWRKLQ